MTDKIIEYLKRYQESYSVNARLARYMKLADAIEANESNALSIKLLKTYVGRCNDALDASDFDLFAQSFEYVIRYAVELNLPQRDKAKQRKMASAGGKAKRKPSDFRQMLIDICNQVGSTENKHVLQCWRKHNGDRAASHAYMDKENTVWHKYNLYCTPLFNVARIERPTDIQVCASDKHYKYFYFDKLEQDFVEVSPARVRQAMKRLRDSGFKAKKLS